MGFLSSFFGSGAAHVYNEMKKDEKETQKWNDNFFAAQNCEQEFSNYLSNIGSNAVYISEVNLPVTTVRNQINQYKRKIQEYLSLGGQGKYIYDLEEIDEYIEIMKYLKSVDCVDRQEEFLGLDIYFAKDTIERENEEKAFQKEIETVDIVGSDINSLSGVEFEKVCQQLVERMGFETETTKASGDGGIDLMAYNYQPLLSGKYIIQCKRYSGSVGEPIIRDLYGVVTSERANKGILMTTGYFTKSAIAFAEGKPIELIDGEQMFKLLRKNRLMEKSFEEIKNDAVNELYKQLDDIAKDIDNLIEENFEEDLYKGLTQEQKNKIQNEHRLREEKRKQRQQEILNSQEVNVFRTELKKAEERDNYKISSEIFNHYIEHVDCIFQIVTDQTSLLECDMNSNIKNTFKGTVFYWIHTKDNKKVATIEEIVNKKVPILLDFECKQGIKYITLSMDISTGFVISFNALKKIITISNGKSKIILSLPFGNDYKNAYDYLYILKNTNNII